VDKFSVFLFWISWAFQFERDIKMFVDVGNYFIFFGGIISIYFNRWSVAQFRMRDLLFVLN
jgi:hypothetical protein